MLKVYYLKVSDFSDFSDEFFLDWVGEDTYNLALSFSNDKVRRTKLLGETMIRKLLLTVWGLKMPDYKLIRGEHGKPYLSGNSKLAYFNLSHSDNYIVCAVSECEVGIDIERKGKMRMEVARRFFHSNEVCALEKLPDELRSELFFRFWSVKESFLKYTGTGLSASLSNFEVCFEPDHIWVKKEHSRLPVQVRECLIDEAYSCFVCSESSEKFTIEPFVL